MRGRGFVVVAVFALAGCGGSAAPATSPPAKSSGNLVEPETVRAVVRSSFPRLRACYEAALSKDATLAGHVKARIVIGSEGRVASVAADSSNLPDHVVRCVLDELGKLVFPRPDGGSLTVLYPVAFAPEK